MSIQMTMADWLALFGHFMSLSLLAVGGAITTAPDMHRYLVLDKGWMTDPQFVSSIALAQAAPGPNVLFIALIGWNLGLNAGGWPFAVVGTVLALLGTLIPSTTLAFAATRWGHRNRERQVVRAFKQGMAPIVIALLVATGWVLSAAHDQIGQDWPLWTLTAVTTLVVWRTKVHLLWLLGLGALLGAYGLV
jgi:chromate transporter